MSKELNGFLVDRQLGEGSYGVAILATDKTTSKKVQSCIRLNSKGCFESCIKRFFKESLSLQSLKKRNQHLAASSSSQHHEAFSSDCNLSKSFTK